METRLQDILADSDRQGERQIALFQALMAMIALLFLVFDNSAQAAGSHGFAPALLAGTILVSSLLRIRFSRKINNYNHKLHLLTIVDGALIFALVISYSVARELPLQTTFTTPAIVFLVVYTGIRVLRFDPMAVAIAGVMVLAGWCLLTLATSASGAAVSGPVQMGTGFAAMLLALVVAMGKARKILASAAHLSELEAANRKAEDHIEQHEELLRSSIDAILIVDQAGTIERANPAFQTLFGYSEKELVGQPFAVVMSNWHAQALTEGMRRYMDCGESHLIGRSFESEGRGRDGGAIPVDISISPYFSGGKQRFAGFIRDARSRKEQERQLKSEKERAEFANRAKASFLAMMSHEVRTPLHGLLGILDLLPTTQDERDRAELVQVAQNSGKALLQIINDILDFSKLDEGKLSIVNEPFETAKLVAGVVSLIHPLAAEKGLELASRSDGQLPPLLLGDAGRIRQILLNLATNAIKFTSHGSVALTVKNCGTSDAPMMRFEVSDTGKGIDRSSHHLVFREFETLGAPQDARHSGTGLGLAICKRLVAAMGGTIGFESIPDRGSTFWFELPLQPAVERRRAERGPQEELPPVDLSGLRVLAVEDNLTNQYLLRRNLEALGVEVDIAGDGESGLRALAQASYNAVLMDISMPGMDGISATAAIRAMGGVFESLPVIMMSAYAFPEDRERAFAAGATRYLAKPVVRADLVRVLSDVAGKVPAEEAPAIRGEVLQEIVEALAPVERDEFIRQCRADVAGSTAMIVAAAARNDFCALERATHALKGVAGAVGAQTVERLAEQLNAAVRSEKPVCSARLQSLQARSAELLDTIARQYSSGGKTAIEGQAQ